MRLLIDTHVLLWSIDDPSRLAAPARRAIESIENDIFVSAVCLWEIAIKLRSGRLKAADDLPDQIADHPDFRLLPIETEHVWRVRRLPRIHGDPFDQLLIAQALVENMTVVTHDRIIGQYGVPIITA